MTYRTILIDPPWQQQLTAGFTHTKNKRPDKLPYPTMTVEQIAALPIQSLAAENAHLWLWTTDQFLPAGLDLVKTWGFKYMKPVHWIKPSGCGAWWVSRTQTVLFAYRGKLDMKEKLKPNVLFANAQKHSEKPQCSYELIEAVSHPNRIELFARQPRAGWTSVGDGIDGQDINVSLLKFCSALTTTDYGGV